MPRRALAIGGLVVSVIGAAAHAAEFTFTIENVGVQPITPVFVATHDNTFDIFDDGAMASPEMVAIAEEGITAPMEILALGSGGALDFAVGEFILPGESTSVTITADLDHPYLSFAAMLPFTNDAFIGLAYGDNALDLFRGGSPTVYDFTLSYLLVWDAGSELNTELAEDVPGLGGAGSPDEGGVITQPHQGILGIGDVGPEYDFWGLDVAHITVVPEPATLWLLALAALALKTRRQ